MKNRYLLYVLIWLAGIVLFWVGAAPLWASMKQQTIAPTQTVYLPVVMRLEQPTPIPTLTPTITPSPTATAGGIPLPTLTPTLPPPSFDNCQTPPTSGNAANHPIRIVNVDKEDEVVQLQNVSSVAIDLSGWHMCSILGTQEHTPINNILAPGATANYIHDGGHIWRNDLQDDGALYNAAGQLVSYWVDSN